MGIGILGRKIGMTQVFDEEGRSVPVTVIRAGPCTVVRKITADREGYDAVQLGLEPVKPTRLNKPMRGYFAQAGVEPAKVLREFRVEDVGRYEVGQKIGASLFRTGQCVDVTAISRGKGFAGTVKRWGFKRGPMAHGSKYHRRVGSLASRQAARVFPGRRMPGRLGGRRVTVQGLEVVRVLPEDDLMLVKGSVPGIRGCLVAVRPAVKVKKKS